jgi:hypothetical protein
MHVTGGPCWSIVAFCTSLPVHNFTNVFCNVVSFGVNLGCQESPLSACEILQHKCGGKPLGERRVFIAWCHALRHGSPIFIAHMVDFASAQSINILTNSLAFISFQGGVMRSGQFLLINGGLLRSPHVLTHPHKGGDRSDLVLGGDVHATLLNLLPRCVLLLRFPAPALLTVGGGSKSGVDCIFAHHSHGRWGQDRLVPAPIVVE